MGKILLYMCGTHLFSHTHSHLIFIPHTYASIYVFLKCLSKITL